MGREPKHGFVAWLEFKQSSKKTRRQGNPPIQVRTVIKTALKLPYAARFSIDTPKIRPRPFCPPQHVPPWNWMILKLLFLVSYSGLGEKITTTTGAVYQCPDSPKQGRLLTTSANTLPDSFSFDDNDHRPYVKKVQSKHHRGPLQKNNYPSTWLKCKLAE